MANVWFTSDWHLGHRNILKFRNNYGFESIEHHNGDLVKNFNQKVSKRDKTFFLGDMCFDIDALDVIRGLNGRKVLVLGNHDRDSNKRPTIIQLAEVFDDIQSLVGYKDLWLSHAPIHPDELRGKKNVHGHTHGSCIDDPRYLNVCPEHTDFKPIDLNEVRRRFSEKGIDVLQKVAYPSIEPQFMGILNKE